MHQVGVFQLASGNLTGREQVRWYLYNLKAIRFACTEPKPFIYSVHKHHIERVWPKL